VLHEAKADGLKDGTTTGVPPSGAGDRAPERGGAPPGSAAAAGGGPRLEGVSLIKEEQLRGHGVDPLTGREVGVFYTEEKGGKGRRGAGKPGSVRAAQGAHRERGQFCDRPAGVPADVQEAAVAAGEGAGRHAWIQVELRAGADGGAAGEGEVELRPGPAGGLVGNEARAGEYHGATIWGDRLRCAGHRHKIWGVPPLRGQPTKRKKSSGVVG